MPREFSITNQLAADIAIQYSGFAQPNKFRVLRKQSFLPLRLNEPTITAGQMQARHRRGRLAYYEPLMTNYPDIRQQRGDLANSGQLTYLYRPDFNTLGDPLEGYYALPDPYRTYAVENIMRNPERRKAYLHFMDERLAMEKSEALKGIDRAKELTGEPLLGDICIVGGGNATATLLTEIGGFLHTTVLTKKFGGSLVDLPIILNSSIQTDRISAEAPLNGGSTSPSGAGLHVMPDIPGFEVLDAEAKTIVCVDKSIRKYPPADGTADITKMLIDMYADQVITGQNVQIQMTRRVLRADASEAIRVTFLDEQGMEHQHDFRAVVFATGPGIQESQVPNSNSRLLFKSQENYFLDTLEKARKDIPLIRRLLTDLKDSRLYSLTKGMVERKIREAAESVKLPKIFNLSILQELYAFWVNDLGGDERYWPFKDFYVTKGEKPIIIDAIGIGDAQKSILEYIQGNALSKYYPKGFLALIKGPDPVLVPPDIRVYGAPTESKQEYTRDYLRLRYERSVVGPSVSLSTARVASYIFDGENIEVSSITNRRLRRCQYISDCSGLTRPNIEQLLKNSFSLRKITDAYIDTIGKGDETKTTAIYTAGVVNEFSLPDFGSDFNILVQTLGIDKAENIRSLWYWINVTRSLGYRILTRFGINQDKIDGLKEELAERKRLKQMQ